MKYVIVAIIKDEQLYLKEWLDYNFSIGFDHIYLFEDFGSTSHKDICDLYSNVTLKSIADANIEDDRKTKLIGTRQQKLYEFQLLDLKDKADWAAFIDIDEFITFEKGYSLHKLILEYLNECGIYLYWMMYDANNQIYYENKPILERFTHIRDKSTRDWQAGLKSLINLKKNNGLISQHSVLNGVTTTGLHTFAVRSYRKAYIKHYFTKSLEEWSWRFTKKGDVANFYRYPMEFFMSNKEMEYILADPPQFWKDCLAIDFKNKKEAYNRFIDDKHLDKLLLGCGGNIYDDWVNTDIDVYLADKILYVDANEVLPFYDEKFQFVYSEHMIEHLEKEKGIQLFKEIYRCLKPGGVFRLAMPTTEFFERLQTGNYQDYVNWHFDHIKDYDRERTIENVISDFLTLWNHKHIYDINDLLAILKDVGFSEITRHEIQESNYPELRNLEHHGDFITEEYNKLETSILECKKI